MSILHNRLLLSEPVLPRGLRLPIDFFFCSLAEDRQQLSIGIILSGMGSDGTLGLRTIKESGGLVVVQDPASARFDSMPRSAIDTGLTDIVAPAENCTAGSTPISGIFLTLPAHNRAWSKKNRALWKKLLSCCGTRPTTIFPFTKKNTLYRRIERRMGIHQLNRITSYVRYLRDNPTEINLLFRELLIGVTSFFRDPEEWELLRDKALPEQLAKQPAGGIIRAWAAGCSTGEEAYSLAIIFKETLDKLKSKADYSLQIFATDLDQDAIGRARQGFIPSTSPRRSPAIGCSAFSSRKRAVTGSRRRSGIWLPSPPRISLWIRPLPNWICSSAAIC